MLGLMEIITSMRQGNKPPTRLDLTDKAFRSAPDPLDRQNDET